MSETLNSNAEVPTGSVGQVEATEEQMKFQVVKFSQAEINDVVRKHAERTLKRIRMGTPPRLPEACVAFADTVDDFVMRPGAVTYIGDGKYTVQMPLSWDKSAP